MPHSVDNFKARAGLYFRVHQLIAERRSNSSEDILAREEQTFWKATKMKRCPSGDMVPEGLVDVPVIQVGSVRAGTHRRTFPRGRKCALQRDNTTVNDAIKTGR